MCKRCSLDMGTFANTYIVYMPYVYDSTMFKRYVIAVKPRDMFPLALCSI